MKSAIRRSQRDFSLAFKLSVVDQVERRELTYKKAQERYGIRGAARCCRGFAGMVGKTGQVGITPSHEYCPPKTEQPSR